MIRRRALRNMRIYKYIHSCLLVEEGNGRILFDPGIFSFIEGKVSPANFSDLSLIVVTHQHVDHVDTPALKTILEHNQVPVLTNTATQAYLAKEGITATALDEGEYKVGSFTIRAIPAEHEKVLFPVPQNTAFLVNDLMLHPGDSLDPGLYTLKGIPALALPIMAPWATVRDAAKFAEALKPDLAFPIHDGFAKEFFVEGQQKNFSKYFAEAGIPFQPIAHQVEWIEVR